MNTIYLVGFMGCGKSSVGQALAMRISKSYIDTDQYIEKKQQTKIPVIFKEDGEVNFRNYEMNALKEVSSYNIVSTGGGIVEYTQNYKTMKKTGVIIYLQTSFDEVSRRLENDKNRPLWDKNKMKEMLCLFSRRELLYQSWADYIIITDDKTVEEIVSEISNIISNR